MCTSFMRVESPLTFGPREEFSLLTRYLFNVLHIFSCISPLKELMQDVHIQFMNPFIYFNVLQIRKRLNDEEVSLELRF